MHRLGLRRWSNRQKKMTAAYEAKLEEERWYKAELENDIQYRNREFERQMKDTVSAYEAKMAEESWYRVESKEENQRLITECAELKGTVEYWRGCFSKLAAIANRVIEDVPRMLTDAEIAMPIFNPPKAIEDFLGYCRELVGEKKNIVARARS